MMFSCSNFVLRVVDRKQNMIKSTSSKKSNNKKLVLNAKKVLDEKEMTLRKRVFF